MLSVAMTFWHLALRHVKQHLLAVKHSKIYILCHLDVHLHGVLTVVAGWVFHWPDKDCRNCLQS